MPRRSTQRKLAPVTRVLARVGCFAIGTVYVLIGVWAMLALLRLADPAADEERILQRMTAIPGGSVFIGAVALGTVGYIVWLLFEALYDPYHFGKTLKGALERIGIALSTVAYGVITSAAVKVLLGAGGQGEERQQELVARVLHWPAGQWVVGAAGVVVAVTGLYQLKYVYDDDHERRIDLDDRSRAGHVLVNVLGWAGYGARCAILLVLGGFLVRAAWSFDPSAVGDTDSAFNVLGLGGGHLGDALFSAVALGTIAYGALMYVNGVWFDFGDDGA